jgi:hypothetical protein
MAKLGKRAKRLTKLRIHEVSAVDSGAGRGVRIMLAKRDGNRPRYRFNEAGSLVPIDKGPPIGATAIEKARAEIEQNHAASLKRQTEDHAMEQVVDIAKAMENRIATMMKRDPTIAARRARC